MVDLRLTALRTLLSRGFLLGSLVEDRIPVPQLLAKVFLQGYRVNTRGQSQQKPANNGTDTRERERESSAALHNTATDGVRKLLCDDDNFIVISVKSCTKAHKALQSHNGTSGD